MQSDLHGAFWYTDREYIDADFINLFSATIMIKQMCFFLPETTAHNPLNPTLNYQFLLMGFDGFSDDDDIAMLIMNMHITIALEC